MARRHPQPFWRSERDCWFVQIGKTQHKLSAERDEAFRLYHELMRRTAEAAPPPPRDAASLSAIEVLDAFLE